MTRVIDAFVALWATVSVGLLIACCFTDASGPAVVWILAIPLVAVLGSLMRALLHDLL